MDIKPKDFSNYLFRSSNMGKLVGAYVNKAISPALTEPQQREYDRLRNKDKITDLQYKKLADFEAKIEAKNNGDIQLEVGTKSELKRIFRKECLQIDPFSDSKATTRGTRDEDESINLINKLYKTKYTKNETKLVGTHTHGTPDILTHNIVDVKTAQDYITFESFNETNAEHYSWQLWDYKQNYIYNLLLNHKKSNPNVTEKELSSLELELNKKVKTYIARVLPSYPDEEIQKEINFRSKYLLNQNIDELNTLKRRIWLNMNFDRFPLNKRVKLFEVQTFDGDPNIVYEYLDVCRKYLNGIVNNWFSENYTV